MFEIIAKALITGILLSVLVGPVFFVLLETSIRKGARAAFTFDAGVLLSDLIYISIALFFYTEVENLVSGKNNIYLKFIGGAFFVMFGIITFFKKSKERKEDSDGNQINTRKDYLKLFLKGFFLNFANPVVIFYWFSVLTNGAGTTVSNLSKESSMFIYITIILITFFSVDALKIFGAKMLRPYITTEFLTGLNRVTGIILFSSGAILVCKGILKFI